LVVNGTIRANGGSAIAGGYGGAGSGSGGGIKITAGSLSGSGTVEASGGPGSSATGAGGGGRIAVFYTSSTLASTSFHAYGGNTFSLYGSAGTVYLKGAAETYGDLIIDNGN